MICLRQLLKIPRSMKYYHEIREYLCDLPFFVGNLSISFSIAYPAILNQKKVKNFSRKFHKSLTKQFLELALI